MSEGQNREILLRQLRRAHREWPKFLSDSAPSVERAWFSLSDEERSQACEKAADYIAACKRPPRQSVCGFAVYLRERRWLKLDDAEIAPIEKAPQFELVAAFGKGGMAARLWTLCQPEAPHPRPPVTVERIIADGGERADDEIIHRRALYSWPRLAEMNRKIMDARRDEEPGLRVAPEIARLGSDFVSTDMTGPVGQAWRRLFRRMKLPFLPSRPGQPDWPRYVYLPPIGEQASGVVLDDCVAAAWWRFRERVTGKDGGRDADAA